MLQIVEEWRNLGIDFVVTTLGIDPSTTSGRLIFGILAQIAEFERELTRERTKLAHERAKKEGRHCGRWSSPICKPDGGCVPRRML